MVLTISHDASALVLRLRLHAGMTGGSGLRIDTGGRYNSLRMALAQGPEGTDATVEGGRGAVVFLSPEAAHRLRRQTLQASSAGGRSAFYLT